MTTARILVIDDNPAIHSDYQKILIAEKKDDELAAAEAALFGECAEVDEFDFEVDLEFAFQGEEGRDTVRAAKDGGRPFAVAFVDMRMPPGWDGLKTIEEIWKVDSEIQVVVCTAYSDHGWADICHRLGHRDNLIILKKPFDSAEVSQLAVALVEKWRLQRSARRQQADTELLVEERTMQLSQAKEELHYKNQQLELAANIAHLGYWRFDIDSSDLQWSPNTYRVLDVNEESFELTIENMIGLFSAVDQDGIREAITVAKEQGNPTECRGSIPSQGQHRYFHTRIQFDETATGCSLFAVTQDVTDQEKAVLKIKHAALHDPLTDLPNRAKFQDELVSAVMRSKRGVTETGLVLLDLDNFKEINDTMGHPVGDQLLKKLAERLEKAAGEQAMVSRLGGDEFAIVVSTRKLHDEISLMLERLNSVFADPFEIEGYTIIANFSAGIALAPDDGSEPDELLKNADLALYKAKNDGRGCHRFFESAMDVKFRRRRELETELHRAVAQEQFEIHYQPIMWSDSEEVSCFEALLRWQHPEKGLIPPLDFIPIAEACGLIVPIGKWVLYKACKDAANWPDNICVAVNVSAVQFGHDSLVEYVMGAIAEAGIAPSRLELEITETIFLEDSERTLETLHVIRDAGVRVVMDDFGVGYSSLSYLRRFPFDKLKLDRSFVQNSKTNVESRAILRAVAGLGNALGMQTTAEGVEDLEQLQHICDEGYSYVQGFLLGKPKPVDKLEFTSGAPSDLSPATV